MNNSDKTSPEQEEAPNNILATKLKQEAENGGTLPEGSTDDSISSDRAKNTEEAPNNILATKLKEEAENGDATPDGSTDSHKSN